MAKGRKKPPAMKSVNLAKPQFYYHSPNVDDQFIPADALHSPGPAIGLPMHQDPELFERIRQHGVAPDWLFRHGLAAPPLPGNESGLRHYVARGQVAGEEDQFTRSRLQYCLSLLLEYGKALGQVRRSGVVDFKNHPNGM